MDTFVACLTIVVGLCKYVILATAGLIIVLYLFGLLIYGAVYWLLRAKEAIKKRREQMMFTEIVILPDTKKWSS